MDPERTIAPSVCRFCSMFEDDEGFEEGTGLCHEYVDVRREDDSCEHFERREDRCDPQTPS